MHPCIYTVKRNIEAAPDPPRITMTKPVRKEICNEVADILESTRTEAGLDFVSLVEKSPVLLVFLRHAGCTFCRESLSDIARNRAEIERTGTRIVLVHMGDRKEMRQLIERYGLSSVDRICDLDRRLYAAFGLKNGKLWQLFGPKAWWRVLVAGFLRGHGVWFPTESMRQMPGVFFIQQGELAKSFRHRSIADRPSYMQLVQTGPNN
jgi:peroxiredoxin